MIKIVSYNIFFGRKSKKIFPWLLTQKNADILCLQEFPEHKIYDCISVFKKNKYAFAFAPSLRIFRKIYGVLTIYRTDRVNIKKTTIINLGTNRAEKTILRTPIPRTGILTEFTHKRKRFAVVNCHLVNIASNKLRYQQIKIILDTVKTHTFPTFIIGDFNIPSLLANNKLIAYMKNHGFSTLEKRMATFRFMFIRYQMDYVFARMGIITDMIMDRKIRFSDHYPITASIRLAK